MNHPQLRNNERQIRLDEKRLVKVNRICFLFPEEGNAVEYMAIVKGQPGFQDVLNQGMMTIKLIITRDREIQEAADRNARLQTYLRLKEEFGDE